MDKNACHAENGIRAKLIWSANQFEICATESRFEDWWLTVMQTRAPPNKKISLFQSKDQTIYTWNISICDGTSSTYPGELAGRLVGGGGGGGQKKIGPKQL